MPQLAFNSFPNRTLTFPMTLSTSAAMLVVRFCKSSRVMVATNFLEPMKC